MTVPGYSHLSRRNAGRGPMRCKVDRQTIAWHAIPSRRWPCGPIACLVVDADRRVRASLEPAHHGVRRLHLRPHGGQPRRRSGRSRNTTARCRPDRPCAPGHRDRPRVPPADSRRWPDLISWSHVAAPRPGARLARQRGDALRFQDRSTRRPAGGAIGRSLRRGASAGPLLPRSGPTAQVSCSGHGPRSRRQVHVRLRPRRRSRFACSSSTTMPSSVAGCARFFDLTDDIRVIGEAPDGAVAIAEARRLEPDVILMDLLMPNTDGLEAIAAIKKAQPSRDRCRHELHRGRQGHGRARGRCDRLSAEGRRGRGGRGRGARAPIGETISIRPSLASLRGGCAMPRHADRTREPLTARELEVSRSSARARSNKEIATALLSRSGRLEPTSATSWASSGLPAAPRPRSTRSSTSWSRLAPESRRA